MSNETSRRGFLAAAGAGAAIGVAGGLVPSARTARADADGPAPGLRILVLGGTGQTGPHFVRRALAHGHEVTLFNRGNRSEDLFPGVECLVGNRYPERDEGLSSLEAEVAGGRRWDVVLDTWPHLPRLVEATAELLKESAGRYMFISSMSVYADSSVEGQDETAEVGRAPNADEMEFDWSLFGPFKAECENRVRRAFPNRNTIWRPGLIVGPRDFSYRGGYWPVRVRRGGEVLAPGDGETRIQMIDARDLTRFELRCMERDIRGTFNVVGPHPRNPLTMLRMLESCRRVSGSDAEFTWVPAGFLADHGVAPWSHMPCWLPAEGEYAGFGSRRMDKAIAAGLTFRPIEETIEDTLQWHDSLDEERREGLHQRAGLPAEKEREVLQAWHAQREGE